MQKYYLFGRAVAVQFFVFVHFISFLFRTFIISVSFFVHSINQFARTETGKSTLALRCGVW